MGFNDWIQFDPAPMAALENEGEVSELAMGTLAKEVQQRLRSTLDPGIGLQSAIRAQSVRVAAEGDQLVIDQEDQAEVLGGAPKEAEDEGADLEVTNMEQLFEMGSGVPRVINGKLTYRTVSTDVMFGDQKRQEQERVVEQTTVDVMRTGLVDAFEDAIQTVSRRSVSE